MKSNKSNIWSRSSSQQFATQITKHIQQFCSLIKKMDING